VTDTLAGVAIGAVLGFVGGWALKYVGPKSRLVYWFPHSSFFQIPEPGSKKVFSLMTGTVTVQNIGRRPATNVEVVHSTAPDHFTLTPPRTFTEHETPQGHHVIVVPSLGHNEWFTIEVLGFGNTPALLYVRSHEGSAQTVPIMAQRIWPQWVNWLIVVLMLTGAGYLLYWALRGLKQLARLLGIL